MKLLLIWNEARRLGGEWARMGSLWLALGLQGALSPAHAVTVYDANGGLPSGQGWTTLSIGAAGTSTVGGGLLTLDSTGASVDTWGHSRFSPISLNTVSGYRVDFGLRVLNETHANNDRAGFSMLFVGADATRSIELAFWQDQVFAYEYVASAFVHGVGAAIDTTAGVRNYSLTVDTQQFTLSADGNVLFAGNLQNYTPQGVPYVLPGFMFFGDNTSSGSAQVELSSIILTAVPEASTWWLWLAGLAVVAIRARRLG